MLDSQYSIYEIIQVLGLSVFVKTSIKELIINVQDNQYHYEEPNYLLSKNNATAVMKEYKEIQILLSKK